MHAFQQNGQSELTNKYTNELYFQQLYPFYKDNVYKMFTAFFKSLMPRRQEVSDDLINKMKDLRKLMDNTAADLTFGKMIDEGVDMLMRQQSVRKFAASYKSKGQSLSE